MRMTFIAYDPVSKEKIKLNSHIRTYSNSDTQIFYCDDDKNFAYNPTARQLFERRQYTSVMEVIILNKAYYLIGEYK
nr:hypothetical protein [Acinetobacter calcoaceticus]